MSFPFYYLLANSAFVIYFCITSRKDFIPMKKSKIIIFTLLFITCNISSQIFLEDENFSDKDYPLEILSEGFNTPAFPPYGWSTQIITGTYNWAQASSGAYCNTYRSAFIPFNISPSGQVARLISPVFIPTSTSRDSLIFSEAYCQKPGVTESLEIFISTNSGTTWQLFSSFNSGTLMTAPATSTYFTPTCNQWQNKSIYLPLNTNRICFQAAGGNGNNLYVDEVLVKPSFLSGIPQYSTEVPVDFKLHNNYPNPFNPTTKIRFDITERTNVKIIIYNSAGKEINVLVDSELGAGKYETSFTALDISSGIYFYRIITDNFTDTKKMILVK